MASYSERERLTEARALEWKGALSTAQFVERNRRLFDHPFGKSRITTYLYLDDHGNLRSSLDVLTVLLGLRTSEEPPREEWGTLVASVLTPPERRGKGYAREIFSWFLDHQGGRPGVLYSDIDPKFYARFGYSLRERSVVEISAQPQGEPASPLSFEEGVRLLNDFRWERLRNTPGPALTTLPDGEFLDWQVERFRFFAREAEAPLPTTFFWKVWHDGKRHFLFGAPNYLAKSWVGLWVHPECNPCQSALGGLASQMGFRKALFWGKEKSSPKIECPMARVPGLKTVPILDPQWCDWW